MKTGIVGAGSIAFATAAWLLDNGQNATLWSPSGAGTDGLTTLTATGAVEGMFTPGIAASAADLCRDADVILIAVPGYGHRTAFEAIAPHLRPEQPVIVSSHASFGALYLGKLLAARGVTCPVVCWGTTLVTGRATPERTGVLVNTVRSRIDICTLPDDRAQEGLALCRMLFGERFVQRDGLLAITLSNLNPQNHMGIALANMTRMETGETWSQGANITPNVGRLLEALDAERLAIASVLKLEVRTIFDHFHLSFHVPRASVSDMNQQMAAMGTGGTGPATADSRYVTEDAPYGLHVTATLGDLAGAPAPLHRAGVAIFSVMYGRDFAAENTLLDALNLNAMTLAQLREAARRGHPTT